MHLQQLLDRSHITDLKTATVTRYKLTITSAIALVPNDLTSRHFLLACTFVQNTLLEACVFGLICVAIDTVEFDHTVVLVAAVGLTECEGGEKHKMSTCGVTVWWRVGKRHQDAEASFPRTLPLQRFDEAHGILPSTSCVTLRGTCGAQHQVTLRPAPSTLVPLISGTLRLLLALALTVRLTGAAFWPNSLGKILTAFGDAKVVERLPC